MSLDIGDKNDFLHSENKLLKNQQNNYKDLCKVLTQRHVELSKYLGHLKDYLDQLFALHPKQNSILYNNYANSKNQHENCILKYDKQIQLITQTIQSSNAQITDNEGIHFKEQLKLLSSSLSPTANSKEASILSNNVGSLLANDSFSKFRCEYFECLEEFDNKEHLDSHLRIEHNVALNLGDAIEDDENHYLGYNKKTNEMNDTKINEILFIPQMHLEELEYGSDDYAGGNAPIQANSTNFQSVLASGTGGQSSSHVNNNHHHGQHQDHHQQHLQSNGYKKMALCDYCGKYFNKHYLESHKRSHTGAKPFKCSIDGCNRTFTQSSSRNYHEKRFHSLTKHQNVYKCNFPNCSETFFRIEHFEKHLPQHPIIEQQHQQPSVITSALSLQMIKSEEPKRSLNLANKKTGPHNRRNNQSTQHKHVCNVCGKSFPYKIALRQHSQLHGEKKYQCPFEDCNYAGYWKHNFNLHLRKHHNAEPQ